MINPILAALEPVIDLRQTVPLRISLATLRQPYTPCHIRIVWDTMDSTGDKGPHGTTISCMSRPPDTTLAIKVDWTCAEELEDLCLDAAWSLGAGYLWRYSRGPRPALHWDEPGSGIKSAFGSAVYEIMGAPDALGDSSMQLAPRAWEEGYWEWEWNAAWPWSALSAKKQKNWRLEETGECLNPRTRKPYPASDHRAKRGADGRRDLPVPPFHDSKLYQHCRTFEESDDGGTVIYAAYDLTCLRAVTR